MIRVGQISLKKEISVTVRYVFLSKATKHDERLRVI